MKIESCGIVVEGDIDEAVYRELIAKIFSSEIKILARPTAGVRNLNKAKKVRGWLHSFEHASRTGGPLDKALVIRDADGKDPKAIENDLGTRIGLGKFAFPLGVAVHAVREEMETWLLADNAALNRISKMENGNPIPPLGGHIEDERKPKERLQRILGKAGLNYNTATCCRIAREIDLNVLRQRCPSFTVFEQKVLDP
ncbi:MAG: DUF4276 family protein [Acidobacteriia bacterium]|nr:DUF4276 family protein [Terriglobia bacterium]